MNEKVYYKVEYHYKNIPRLLQKAMSEWFMKNRNEVASIYNKYIDMVNAKWKLTGEPSSFGEYIEDINPRYSRFIYDEIQPYIDLYNNRFTLFKYKIDKYGDLVGYVPFIRNSQIWITLKKV